MTHQEQDRQDPAFLFTTVSLFQQQNHQKETGKETEIFTRLHLSNHNVIIAVNYD